jgi:hypothetical protein
MFFVLLFLSNMDRTIAQEEPAKPGQVRGNKDRDTETEDALPKYDDMVLPTAEELLRSKPFDWIVLKSMKVLVVEPVSPRPETLSKLNAEADRYLKGGRAGFPEGEEILKQKRRQFLRLQITLVNPGTNDIDPDGELRTEFILRIEYFEDLILRRANELIDEGRIPLAYDLLLLVDQRHHENNVRIAEAYEIRKKEEDAAKAEGGRLKYTLPEPTPLKLGKAWPKFDETYHRLLFKDAEIRSKRGEDEAALRLLENLWDHNPNYPALSERFGEIVDTLIAASVERSDFRQARYFLNRLSNRDNQHPVATNWKADLLNRTKALIEQAREASSQGNAARAASIIESAARVWPESPGLKDAHRELIDRYQSVRLAVTRLPGTPTNYPFEPLVDCEVRALTSQLLFEPIRVDERSVRYRSSLLDSWEPKDLGREVQFNLRLKRADWEAHPVITSADIQSELAAKINPNQPNYDERLAGTIERISVQSPSQFTIQFRRPPLRLEALLQFSISLSQESRLMNPDIAPGAESSAGRQRFFEAERLENQVAYRRVCPQPATAKPRNIDEIVEVRYESWERALQGLLRGEIAGITHVGLRDLKELQEDKRFFVVPYALPISHFILFHPGSTALRDGQLRRALSLALPRDELIRKTVLENVKEPLARITTTPFPSTSYGHNRLLAEPAYDPQRAAALALTAKKQLGGELPVLRLACPPDPATRAIATEMIGHWKRVGVTVRLNDDSGDGDWDMGYRTTTIIEPISELWPLMALRDDAKIESLKPLPDRVRRQLVDLEQINDWTTATKLLRRIETELLIEVRYIPLWEVDDFFVTRRHLLGLPPRLMHPFQDAERWTLQSWYPQETP